METDVIEPGPGALASYYEWLDSAPYGRTLAYYLGDLQYDRDPQNFGTLTVERRRDIDALNTLADRILKDARDGLVKIFQRKHAENVREYLAVMQRRQGNTLSDPLRNSKRERDHQPA